MTLLKPEISTNLALTLAKDLFGFSHISKVKELISFADRNYYIKGLRMNESQPSEYVLKVLNSVDSQEKEQVQAELKALEFLRKRGFPCPEVFSVAGSDDKLPFVELPSKLNYSRLINNFNQGCGNVHVVRLIAFLPGDEVVSFERNPELMFTVGKLVGTLSLQLKVSFIFYDNTNNL